MFVFAQQMSFFWFLYIQLKWIRVSNSSVALEKKIKFEVSLKIFQNSLISLLLDILLIATLSFFLTASQSTFTKKVERSGKEYITSPFFNLWPLSFFDALKEQLKSTEIVNISSLNFMLTCLFKNDFLPQSGANVFRSCLHISWLSPRPKKYQRQRLL